MSRRALQGLLLACALAWPASAQEEGRPPGPGPTPEERWGQMTPEEREVLRQRFDEYMQLTEAHRQELRRRFERVRVLQEAARARLPVEVRLQLEALQGVERRALLQEYYEGELAERGRRVRELLPPHWRERLERAESAERDRLVAALGSERRLRAPERLLDELGGRLDLPEEERERLRKLPPEQRFNELVTLRRRALEERIEKHGLPGWMTQEQWEALRELGPRQFLEALHKLEGGRGDAWRGGVHQRLLRPDPGWLVELSALDPEARRLAVDERLRQRVLDHLAAKPDLVSTEEMQRLRGMRGRDLQEAMRMLLRRARCEGEHEHARHRPGGPPPRDPPPEDGTPARRRGQ